MFCIVGQRVFSMKHKECLLRQCELWTPGLCLSATEPIYIYHKAGRGVTMTKTVIVSFWGLGSVIIMQYLLCYFHLNL